MTHERPDDDPAPALGIRLNAEVHRFEVAVSVQESQIGQAFQVPDGLFRRDTDRENAGIRGDDEILILSTLQTEHRHPEGLILIGLVDVQVRICGLGNAPGHAELSAVCNLDRHGIPGSPVEE